MPSVTDRPACAVMPNTLATASGRAAGSPMGASSTSHTPSPNSPTSSATTCTARRVLPTPPTPVNVTRRCARISSMTSFTSTSRPTKLVDCTGNLPGTVSIERKVGNSRRSRDAASWNTEIGLARSRSRCSPKPMTLDRRWKRTAHQRLHRIRHDDLTTVTGLQQPRASVQRLVHIPTVHSQLCFRSEQRDTRQ